MHSKEWLSEIARPGLITGHPLLELDPELPESAFEEDYFAIRKLESRTYSDAELVRLPIVSNKHPHRKEWAIRGRTARRMQEYLASKPKGWKMLDLGCGNGWMSAKMAESGLGFVLGMDLGRRELEQAARVFQDRSNLAFLRGDVFSDRLLPAHWDFVVIAAAFQYFPDPVVAVQRFLELLKPGGELHILDTPFYTAEGKQQAAARSLEYYTRMGYPALAAHYHAHSLDDLNQFSPNIPYDPASFLQRIMRKLPGSNLSPFPWIMIRKP